MAGANNRMLTAFTERNLSLKGKKLPEARYEPSLSIEFDPENDNKIRFIAWSGLPGEDGRQTPIRINMEAYSFAALAIQAEKVSGIPAGTEMRGIKVNGVRAKKPGDETRGPSMGWDGTIFVGKDQEEVCYVCLMSKGNPKLKFIFAPSNWSQMVDVRTNEPAPMSLVSQDYAEAWARIVLPIATALLVEHPYDFKLAREARDAKGTDSTGSRPSQPQRSSAPAPKEDYSSFDDDIPI